MTDRGHAASTTLPNIHPNHNTTNAGGSPAWQPARESMQGLKLTYETLGKTRNVAALDVLLSALKDRDAAQRRRALAAILCRSERRSAEEVLANWDLLGADDLRVLRPRKRWIAPAIDAAFKEGGEPVATAITAARALELTTAIPHLVLLAESSRSRPLRLAASEAIIEMVQPLGRDARGDRDQPTVRGPVLSRLADSVRRFSMHQNEKLVDAFLMIVNWGDGDFRQIIGEQSEQRDLICERLRHCEAHSVNELVAGFLRRRTIPAQIGAIIYGREFPGFREALLRAVSSEPSATVIRNLGEIGTPRCCDGGESLMRNITPEYRAALAHVYSATEADDLRRLHVVATAVEAGGSGCVSAAASCFSRCEVPAIETWMRAAVPIADGDQEAIANDDNARLLQRLINLLDHADQSLVKGVRRVLGPLHADQMLHRFESLRPRSRRKLGRIVMMIDPDAIDRIRDALRHPVLASRLAAIATADALAVVDLLSDSFEHISREDHQEARILAANVMSNAESEVTLSLLQEMVDLPVSPVRDAAVEALSKRKDAVA